MESCTVKPHGSVTCICTAMQDFLRNNRGINDGGDLPLEFMEDIYNRIVHNEIKMKVTWTGRARVCQGPSMAWAANLSTLYAASSNGFRMIKSQASASACAELAS